MGLNGQYFLKNGGNFVISIKASCIDSTAVPEAVFAREVKKLQEMQMKPKEQARTLVRPPPAAVWCAVAGTSDPEHAGDRCATLMYVPRRCIPCTCATWRSLVSVSIRLGTESGARDWCAQVTLEPYERDHAVVCGVFRCASRIYW